MIEALFVLVCFVASTVGCICGIGGGVIIKPVLDSLGIYSASTISFMSGCIVLAMTCYSVLKAQLAGESQIEKRVTLPLGIGAAIGGVTGKLIFDVIRKMAENANMVGAVQSVVLLVVTLGTLLYMLNSSKIRTHTITNRPVCGAIGLALGSISAFLGIGGGPINLVVLSFFFSMETKTAAQNSLFIILLSQIASLLLSVFSRNIPSFPIALFACMVAAGILGGIVGRKINKRIDAGMVHRMLIILIVVIMLICCYNFYQYCFK